MLRIHSILVSNQYCNFNIQYFELRLSILTTALLRFSIALVVWLHRGSALINIFDKTRLATPLSSTIPLPCGLLFIGTCYMNTFYVSVICGWPKFGDKLYAEQEFHNKRQRNSTAAIAYFQAQEFKLRPIAVNLVNLWARAFCDLLFALETHTVTNTDIYARFSSQADLIRGKGRRGDLMRV